MPMSNLIERFYLKAAEGEEVSLHFPTVALAHSARQQLHSARKKWRSADPTSHLATEADKVMISCVEDKKDEGKGATLIGRLSGQHLTDALVAALGEEDEPTTSAMDALLEGDT